MSALADLLQSKTAAILQQWPEPTRALIAALRASDFGGVMPTASHEAFRDEVFSLIERAELALSTTEARTLTKFFVELAGRAGAPQLSLRTITDALPVLVSYVAADERYGMVNKAYEDWFGIPRDELLGKTLREVVGPAAYDVLSPNVKRALSGERFSFEQYGVPYRLGGRRDVHVDFIPHFDDAGKPDGYVALLQDITRERTHELEREAARAEAQAERDKQRALFMQAPFAIAILEGPEHMFTLANDAYRALVNGRDVVGKPLLSALPELADQGFAELLTRVMKSGETYYGKEAPVKLQTNSGEEVVRLDFTYTPARDATGRIYGVLVSCHDVTETVRARERVEHLRQLAESANRSKDQFLAMLGHELRNPLAPISTALELMKLGGAPAFAREREIIERQVDHLTRLVDDLLDVSRIMSGKTELARRRVDIAEVVSSAIEIASPLLESRRHHLEVSVETAELEVAGDAIRLAQVLSNLLTNAAKYTEPGGRIELSAFRDDDQVVLRVRDNGIGIGSEMLESVFELFAQEQQSLERARGGLGLGLTIVRSLVELHGGTATAESAGHGHGSTFTVRLPVGVSNTPPPSRVERNTGVPARPLRVLVVDDNADAAELLSFSLARSGHDVRVAHDGPSALQMLEQFTPEVAVLDIGLPVMDGYELAVRLRAMSALRDTRLIALTGYGQATDRERSAQAGFDAHLVKPVRLAELEACFAAPAAP